MRDGDENPRSAGRSRCENDQHPPPKSRRIRRLKGRGVGRGGSKVDRNAEQLKEKIAHSAPPWTSVTSISTPWSTTTTPATASATTATLKIRLWYMLEFSTIVIRTRVRPPWTRMNEATILPRVTLADPFIVEILDCWGVGNECEFFAKSRGIIEHHCHR